MDPGSRDSLVKVYKRVTRQGDFGPELLDREYIGSYWAAITYITTTLVLSGYEMYKPDALWPMPVVRFIFELDFDFDYATTEFHFNNFIFCPREPGVRPGSARGSLIVYNCIRQIPGEEYSGGSGSGSGSGGT